MALLAGLPVFFINIKTGHDWGDDFARYLEQARNIISGLPQDKSGFIPNPDFYIGPQSYPAGFPIILALWGKLFSLEIISLNYLISIFLFAAAIALFLIYRRDFSPFIALCLILLFLYHPLSQALKSEVLSDIPYTTLSLLCLLFYKPEKKYFLLASGLLLAFSVHTRSIGFMLAIAFAVVHGTEAFSGLKKQMKPEWKKYFFFWGSAVIFYLLIMLLFPVSSNYLLTAGKPLKQTFLTHSYYYLWVLDGSFKEFDQQNWRILGMLAGSAFITLGIIGWILSLKNNPSHRLIDIYCLLYYLMISFYPYGDAGFRFLLPIFGFILFYVAVALKYFMKDFHFNKKIIAGALTLVLFYQYSFGLGIITDKTRPQENGPNTPDAADMLAFIKSNVKDDESICFSKPKALSYYSGKKCVSINESRERKDIKNELDKWNCSWFAYYSGVSGDVALHAVAEDTLGWTKVFGNSSSQLFKRKK
jgi:hypothetical protein